MNIKGLLFSALVVTSIILGAIFLVNQGNVPAKYSHRTEGDNDEGIKGAIEWLNQIRQNPETGTVDINDVLKARNQVMAKQSIKNSFNIKWENIGPNNIGGRTRAILVDKDNSSIIYAGSVAGGIFKSVNGGLTWKQVEGGAMFKSLAISCIAQGTDGSIYVGTGEYFAAPGGTNSNTGIYGQGMWKSTDGVTFTQLASTWDTTVTYSTSSDWVAVNEIAINKTTGRIFAATKGGLYISDDGGTSWTEVLSSLIRDVKVASNGKVYAVRNNNLYVSDNGDNGTFTGVVGVSSGGRMEIAIAPSDDNYVYVFGAASDGSFGKMYRSTDAGSTFSVIFDGSSETLSPFGSNKQGWYDNIVAVYPDDPSHILFGGVDLYSYSDEENYSQLTAWYLDELSSYYVHADQHAIVFDPKYDGANNKKIYFGCDGGIFKSNDGGVTFSNLNRGYITTQFYGMGIGSHGEVVGGLQDNGSIFIDRQGSQPTTGQSLTGGDGGAADISFLRPEVMFTSMYYGQIYRTEGGEYDAMYDSRILTNHSIGSPPEPFVTRFALWESFNDSYSQDSIKFYSEGTTAGGIVHDSTQSIPFDSALTVGDTITVPSKTRNRNVLHILTSQDFVNYLSGYILPGDSLQIQDYYQAAFAVGLNGEVFVTRDPVDFSQVPARWAKVASTSAPASTLAWSSDGNYLYVADGYFGGLYRISNFNLARSKAEMEITDTNCLLDSKKIYTFSARYVTSISVDPQNPANIIVTLGNYGQSSHVYFSTNATSSSPSFIDVTGDLPEMPVYASIILWNNSQQVLIGTEYGVYACNNILASSPTWEEANADGLSRVPVFQLVQQVIPNFWEDGNTGIANHGYIYAASHGKGIYETSTFHGPVSEKPVNSPVVAETFGLYPNPASDFVNVAYKQNKNQPTFIDIYNLKGQKVISNPVSNQTIGVNHIRLNISGLSKGVYLVNVNTGSQKQTMKLIIN